MRTIFMFLFLSIFLVACSDSAQNEQPEKEKETTVETTNTKDTKKDTAKDTVETEPNKTKIEGKKDYMAGIVTFEEQLVELEITSQNGSPEEKVVAQTDLFNRWDDKLNELFLSLEKQLPAKEYASLQEDQANWKGLRDAVAKEESLKHEDPVVQQLELVKIQSTMTKDRVYQLVLDYMK